MQKVRYGFIGAGQMACGHLHCVDAIPDIELVAVADPSDKSLNVFRHCMNEPSILVVPGENLMAKYRELESAPAPPVDGKVKFFSDHRELLALGEVDAVVIATPDHTHADIVVDSLAADKHVLSEKPAATSHEQLRKLGRQNALRLELVERMTQGLRGFGCFVTPSGREDCVSTYYIYPLRYLSGELGGRKREDLIAAINAEGIQFYQGYVKPLYMQPLFQRRIAFKHGYPWAAPENSESRPDYSPGSCPNAETLHFHQMIVNEHIRPPNGKDDVDDIVRAVEKVLGGLVP